MRQATLPWAPPPSLHPTDQGIGPYQQLPPDPSLDPALFDIDTPPLPFGSPALSQAQQPQQLDPQLQLDPSLFSSSQNEIHDLQAIDVSTPEPIPQTFTNAADMVSSSSSGSSSAATSTTVPASTQQIAMLSATATKPATTVEPLSRESVVETSTPTPASAPVPPIDPAPKPQPALHPFFKPGGGASTNPADTADESDSEQKRPSRSSRTKAPISYREDLKAVLRADKTQEAARLKQEKQQAKAQASAAKKAQKSGNAKAGQENGKGKQKENDEDGFEVVESWVATPKPANKKAEKQTSGSEVAAGAPPSPKKPQPAPKVIQQKPLSLAVKGTSSTATSNPHPFFVKKPKQPPPPPPADATSAPDGGKTEPPQATEDKGKAPVKSAASSSISTLGAAPAAWSLFAAPRASSSKPKKPIHALWPTQEDTHVVGLHDIEAELLTRSRNDLSAFRSRWQPRASTSTSDPTYSDPPSGFVTRMNRARPQPSQSGITLTGSNETFSSLDDYLATHVDISSLPTNLSSHPTNTSGQLWTDAFRPRTAATCLGNESNATYLLEWLRRLLVAAPNAVRTADKKRKHGVVRRVDRKKQRRRRGYSDDEDSDDMGDFIVDDDEDEDAIGEWDDTVTDEEWFSKFLKIDRKSNVVLSDDESVDLTSSQGTATATTTAATVPPVGTEVKTLAQRQQEQRLASLDKLSNCIILTGPSGSGKTASVYACASELGYEVFELYPGMGKRSGKELTLAVGHLGRNHMVSSGGIGGGATFKKFITTTTAVSGSASGSATGGVRQSLILIEEADVLFDEDKGFWPAVVELVAESKRPVVVICNELELVPVHDLPVQEVLDFTKPQLGCVVPWLQTLAANTGRYLDSDQVRDMLLNLPGTETPIDTTSEALNHLGVDLRQALHQLQFGHLATSLQPVQQDTLSTLATAELVDMKTLSRAAESFSLADVFETSLHPTSDIEVFGEGGLEHQPNSLQLGNWTLLLPQPLASQQMRETLVGGANVDYLQAFCAIHQGLAPPPPSIRGAATISEERLLKTLQERQKQQINTLLHPLFRNFAFTQTASYLPPSHIVDYAPIVRQIALVDEDLAQIHTALAAQGSSVVGGGRAMRNSSRLTMSNWLNGENAGGYERWLNLGPEEVGAARLSSLFF